MKTVGLTQVFVKARHKQNEKVESVGKLKIIV